MKIRGISLIQRLSVWTGKSFQSHWKKRKREFLAYFSFLFQFVWKLNIQSNLIYFIYLFIILLSKGKSFSCSSQFLYFKFQIFLPWLRRVKREFFIKKTEGKKFNLTWRLKTFHLPWHKSHESSHSQTFMCT